MKSINIFFHLNIDFSSIDVSRHCEIIDLCYSPLLNLSKNYCLWLEAPSNTLKVIEHLRPNFITQLKDAIENERVIFVGSGRYQIIHDLYSYDVFKLNIELGMMDYIAFTGHKPVYWLPNEMVFSKNLLRWYENVGLFKLMVDRRSIPYLNEDVQILRLAKLDLIMVDSKHWQFVQDITQGLSRGISLSDYINTLNDGEFLYAGDAEHFGVSLGRYHYDSYNVTERLTNLSNSFDNIKVNHLVGSNIKEIDQSFFEYPIYVKKQIKYNLYRWIAGGKINNHLWNSYASKNFDFTNESLELFKSDILTNLTDKKIELLLNSHPKFINQTSQIENQNRVSIQNMNDIDYFDNIYKYEFDNYTEASDYPSISSNVIDMNDNSYLSYLNGQHNKIDLSVTKLSKQQYKLRVFKILDDDIFKVIRPFILSFKVPNKNVNEYKFSLNDIDYYNIQKNSTELKYPHLNIYSWFTSAEGVLILKFLEETLTINWDTHKSYFGINFSLRIINNSYSHLLVTFSVRESNRMRKNNGIHLPKIEHEMMVNKSI